MKARRCSLIGLGLVLPTLAVGALALGLLSRERHRLNTLTQSTAREQAKTVADNMDLIFSEVKLGVSQALEVALARGSAIDRLSELARTNPFVGGYFMLSPGAAGYVLVSDDLTERDLEVYLDTREPPWSAQDGIWHEKETVPELDEVMQALPVIPPQADAASSGAGMRYATVVQNRQAIRDITQENIMALEVAPRRANRMEPSVPSLAAAPAAARSRPFEGDHQSDDLSKTMAEPLVPRAEGRSGWLMPMDGKPGWLVWRELRREGQVGGLVLDVDEVLGQLRGAFPLRDSIPLQVVLWDPEGTVLLESETASGASYAENWNTLALGNDLAGWTLAYRAPDTENGAILFLLGALMVGSLCATTLGAGTLLIMQARRDAREAARKTTFVSNVSHELRTPLTTIRMYAEMLENDRLSDEAKRRRYLETIASESQRLSRLIDNVLDFSRIEQGRKHYHREVLDLCEVLNGVLLSQGPRLQEAGMALHVEEPTFPTRVLTDRDALEQVLLNLIDNAIKYAARGGSLRFMMEAGPTTVRLRVEDKGPGIGRRDRDRVFEAFQRLDDSLTVAQPGAGLGLSISRSLLRELDGDLLLEESENKGCCFVIVLPVGGLS